MLELTYVLILFSNIHFRQMEINVQSQTKYKTAILTPSVVNIHSVALMVRRRKTCFSFLIAVLLREGG